MCGSIAVYAAFVAAFLFAVKLTAGGAVWYNTVRENVMNIIEVNNLQKSYGKLSAVNGITFSVERGSLFSFLGVNGAGKSTTVNILCSILKKDGGAVNICGFDLDKDDREIKRRIGVVFQKTVLDDRLTVRDNLKVRAAFYGITGKSWERRLSELEEQLSLSDILNRPFGKLSGGQRRRADIARGLINKPELLFLDEPTTGLDPQTRAAVWDTVRTLRESENTTVFLTTHYMEEADLSDRVVIIDCGAISAEGTPAELKNKYSHSRLKLFGDADAIRSSLARLGISYEEDGPVTVINCEDAEQARAFIAAYPALCADFEYVKGSMDDVFLSVTGKKLEGGVQ